MDGQKTTLQTEEVLVALTELCDLLQRNESLETFWPLLSNALSGAFSHTSCTILSYDSATSTLSRVYSSRPEVHRLGGRKRVTDSIWSRTVLQNGEILIGSTKDDIRSYFSEHEILLANGWESIMNIPVRKQGKTIGSINIMNGAGAYDTADHGVAKVFAQITVVAIERTIQEGQSNIMEVETLEYV